MYTFFHPLSLHFGEFENHSFEIQYSVFVDLFIENMTLSEIFRSILLSSNESSKNSLGMAN